MTPSRKLSSFLLICLTLTACGQAPTAAGVTPVPTATSGDMTPQIIVNIANTEVVELTVETVSQQNCGGSAEAENEYLKSHAVEHILEAEGGFSVNVNGQIGFAGTDVELGATVAAQLGHSYGTVEMMSRSLTVKARPGTSMEHSIRQTEVWKVGTAKITVGKQETTIPFRFRHDFAIELLSSQDIGCPSATPPPTSTVLPPSATQVPVTESVGATTEAPSASPGGDTGYQGEYFDNDKFQAPVALTRTDPSVIFDWKDANPAPGIPVDHFAVRWTRCLELEARYYIFTIRADDYAAVWVDDLFVVDTYYRNQEYVREFVVAAGRHCIKVEYKENNQAASVYFDFKPGATYTAADESVAWKGEYYNNDSFKEPVAFLRNDPGPIFDWKDANPAPGIPIDHFSVRWTRCFDLEDRYYDFTVRADDYAVVRLDDMFVVDTYYRNQDYLRQFAVAAGRHCIKVEYKENNQAASVYFDFKPGATYTVADESVAWKGEYYNNDTFKEPVAFLRNDPGPIFDWKDANPAPGIPIDHFSVRWTRCFDLEGREYIFTVRADDYARVLVDDTLVVDTYYRNQDYVKPFVVSAGRHCIKVEYKETNQAASVYFGFK
jgi:hypothetical protein